MRRILRGAIGLTAALVLHTLLSRTLATWTPLAHVFLLAVLFSAEIEGELFGAVMGTFCGLAVDALSLGIFGISGLSMTIVGFLAGFIAKRINVLSFFRNVVFLFLMTTLEFVLWSLVAALLVSQPLGGMKVLILARPAVTSLAGALVFSGWRWIRKRHGR